MMLILVKVVRVLVGLFVLTSGVNFYFQLTPLPPLENETGKLLMAAFEQSGMIEVCKVLEIVAGLALVLDLYVPLTLVVFYPITVIIAYLDLLILKQEAGAYFFGGGLFVTHTALLFLYRSYYTGLFARRAHPAVGQVASPTR